MAVTIAPGNGVGCDHEDFMMADMGLLTCTKCGLVHFGMTEAQCRAEVDRFNAYYDTLSDEEKTSWYGGRPATLDGYRRCKGCGAPHTMMRPSVDGDAPDGVTLQPIMVAQGTPRPAPAERASR